MRYNIAMYIRISSSDSETGFTKEESNSIVGQRNLINNYLNKKLELKSSPRTEYRDDGFSGTNARRPEFLRMIGDVKAKKINLIIVKDFSRFFRDYIEMGDYLECVFPFLGVRFISINDNYDSDNDRGSVSNLDVVMRNIVYGAYSRDISTKTKAAKKLMMREGKFVGSHAPFGYRKHPTIKNKLAIDVESAQTVRYIFDLAIEGNNTASIAKKLNEEKRLTPAEYYKLKFPDDKKFKFTSNKTVWTAAQVYLILTNLRYTGALVSNRKEKISISENKYKKADQIIVEGTHEAIIEKKMFDKANLVIKKTGRNKPRIAKEYPLKSFVRCGNCKRLMKRRLGAKERYYFSCAYAYNDTKSLCPKGQIISEEEVEKLVLNALNDFLMIAKKKLITVKERVDTRIKTSIMISEIESQLIKLQSNKRELYETYVAGNISKEEYLKKKRDNENRINIISEKLSVEKEVFATLENAQSEQSSTLEELIDDKNSFTHLDFEIANNFIESIYIYDSENIEIVLKYKDLFQ